MHFKSGRTHHVIAESKVATAFTHIYHTLYHRKTYVLPIKCIHVSSVIRGIHNDNLNWKENQPSGDCTVDAVFYIPSGLNSTYCLGEFQVSKIVETYSYCFEFFQFYWIFYELKTGNFWLCCRIGVANSGMTKTLPHTHEIIQLINKLPALT